MGREFPRETRRETLMRARRARESTKRRQTNRHAFERPSQERTRMKEGLSPPPVTRKRAARGRSAQSGGESHPKPRCPIQVLPAPPQALRQRQLKRKQHTSARTGTKPPPDTE